MNVTSQHRWSRTRYPLQMSLQTPLKASAKDIVPQQGVHMVNGNTHERPEAGVRSTSQASTANDDNGSLPPYEPRENLGGSNGSITAVLLSSRSVSPASDTARRRRQSTDIEDAAGSEEAQLTHFSTTMTPPSADGQSSEAEAEAGAEADHDLKEPILRTLRRIPRSQRITSRGSLDLTEVDAEAEAAEVTEATETEDHPEVEQSTEADPGTSRPPSVATSESCFKRQAYPLQDNHDFPTAQDLLPVSMHREPLDDARDASNHRYQSPPAQSSKSHEPWKTAFVPQPDNSNKTVGKDMPDQRQAYPQQPKPSVADLQQPVAPTQAKKPNQAPETPVKQSTRGNHPSPPTGGAPGRQNYPLQSPVIPMSQERVSPKEIQQTTAEQSTTKPHTTSVNTKPLHRKKYPLQSPASMLNLRQPSASPSAQQSEKMSPATTHESKENSNKSTASSGAPRRRGYPLQLPAAIGDRNQSMSSSQATSPAKSRQTGTDSSGSQKKSSPRRASLLQSYPLQPPVDTADSRHNQTSSPDFAESWTSEPTSTVVNDDHEEEVLLPKHISAVKDANQHDSKGRTIVVCLDGTGDKFDDDNSNIVHLVSALKKDDPNQVTYYQAGIGTYSDGGLSTGFAAAADMAVGSGLGLHVRDAYHFLMHTYKESDRICIFGFSRGAYTARCLAGMIHKIGLLPPRNTQQIMFAYDFYKNDTEEGWLQSEHFKRTFSIDVNIYFLGCFDSVASVGFIPRQLPLSSTPGSKARYFRHAMALDERRAKFKVCRYQAAKAKDMRVDSFADGLPLHKDQNDTPPGYSPFMPFGKRNHPNMSDQEYDRLNRHDEIFETDVSEVWFAGCHADVGGGAVANSERHKLAQIPLRWMIRQTFECDTGIIFSTKSLCEYGLDVHTLWPNYKSLTVPDSKPPTEFLKRYEKHLPPRSNRARKLVPIEKKHARGEKLFRLNSHRDEDWSPEQVEDYYDAMSPMNDQLVQAPSWWILEFWPVEYKNSGPNGEVITRTGMNWGQYRLIEEAEAKLHWTVLSRALSQGHKIYARPAVHTRWKFVA